ncbi:MAG: indolepyruvate oxidoreductase subunit beta [candidate division WOR-3 bacterium]
MNILVCGVGGQGVLLFSDLLANLALSAGLDVKKSEVHGMSQRGGSVTTHIRYGPKIYSPLIEEGTADLVVAFEKLEAVRFVHFLAESGRLVFDPYRIEPLPVQLGLVEPIDDQRLDELIESRTPNPVAVLAFETARRLGNPRVQNVVMLGAVSKFLEFPTESYKAVIRTLVKAEFLEINLAAFAAGQSLLNRL